MAADAINARTYIRIITAAAVGLTAMAPKAEAQVSVNIGVGVAPYACAPAGYFGPEWFNNRVFIGPGPLVSWPKRVDSAHFQGNEVRDGRGHVANEKR